MTKRRTPLENRRSQDPDELERKAEEIGERRVRLEEFRDIQVKIETQQSDIESVKLQFANVLEGVSLDELRNSVKEAREVANVATIKRRIVEEAIRLLHRDEKDSVSCPVCKGVHPRQDLEEVLQQTISELPDLAPATLDQLVSQLERAEKLECEVQGLKSDLDGLEQKAYALRESIDPDDALPEMIKRCLVHEASIKEQIDGHEGRLNEIERQFLNLREEERFHGIQKKLTSIKQSRKQFEGVEKAYDDLVVFGESVQSVREAVKICLKERLENDIPRVSESLSKVFASLTHHPWYDRLTIAKDKLPKLELQVASSHDPSDRGEPTGVLNGQSESALELVPYFAFSQADDTPTEVYLVLLDDPTRAFDEEHTGILVEQLAELGRNVQLIVASQETARFRELLPKNFESDDYVIVEPNQWTHSDGPRLKIERNEPCKT